MNDKKQLKASQFCSTNHKSSNMNYLKNLATGIFLFLVIGSASAFEYDITTICKHPNQPLLYIGGTFNTILIVNESDGTPKNQIDIDYHVEEMEFTFDGSELMVFDGSTVHFLNPETGEQNRYFSAEDVHFYEGAPYFTDVSWMDNQVKVYSAKDGSLIGTINTEFPPLDAGFNADFSELIILGLDREIEKEKSLITEEVEEIDGYNCFNSAYLKQQKDGRGSDLLVYEISSMTQKMAAVLPYKTSNNFDLTITGFGGNYYIGCWDMLIRVDSDGKAYPIQPEEGSFTYASSASADGKWMVTASSSNGTIVNCETGKYQHFDVKTKFAAPTNADITISGDDIYMISDDYSITKMNTLGQASRNYRLSKTMGAGYGVYYYNGKNAGAERDSENEIINKALAARSMESIDLNEAGSSRYVQIGTFETLESAEQFMDELGDAGLNYTTVYAPVKKG